MAIGTPTVIEEKNETGSATTMFIDTPAAGIVAGGTVVYAWCGQEGGSAFSPSDDQSNSYSLVVEDTDHTNVNMHCRVQLGNDISAALVSGDDITLDWTTSVSQRNMSGFSVTGIATSSPLDGSAIAEFNGSTTPDSGNITTTVANTLLVGVVTHANPNRGVSTEPSGWTSLLSTDTVTNGINIATREVTSAGTYNYDPTMKLATAGFCSIFALEADAGGGNAETLAAVASGVAGLNRRLLAAKPLSATATGTADLSIAVQVSRILAAVASGVATLVRLATWRRTLSATAAGLAVLVAVTAGQFARALTATATGVAGLNRRLSVNRTLAAVANGTAAIALVLSLSRTIAAIATGAAVLNRRLSAFRTLAATATGNAIIAAGRLFQETLAAIATGVATLTAVFTEAPEEPTTPFSGDAGIKLLGRRRWSVRRTKWRRRR